MIAKRTARYHALERHIRRIEKRLQNLEYERHRFSRFRPAIFLAGVALTYWTGWTSIIIAAILITIEAVYDNRLGKVMRRHRLWLKIKKTQCARMEIDWRQIPEPPFIETDEQHPFEIDLNVTGRCSLHHLVDTAISREGSRRLRDWLLETCPDSNVMTERQKILRELVPLSRFRDKLLLHFHLVSKEHLDSEKLLRWLRIQSPSQTLQRMLPFSIGLAALNILLFAAYAAGWLPGYWLLSLAVYLVLYFSNVPKIQHSFDAIMVLYDELDAFKTILRYLEKYPYGNHPQLKRLCSAFCEQNPRPSALLKKITWLTTAVGLRMNPALALALNIVVPWDMIFASQAERCRRICATQFPQWVDAWSELESLVSLANFAYLNPDYCFPELADASTPDTPLFEATALGHPLIPREQRVCNDFTMRHIGDITLLTGSNMAGKSTFLKTIGLNLCLAYAGSPVNARHASVTPFRVCTCIQIHDSVTDGFSYFYAEVRRLKKILDAVHDDESMPVLFLIDEIFKGTNSRERLIGGRAYIHHLSKQQGVGLIATHDLELGQLAEDIPGMRNAHFRDDVAQGRMVFDYLLRPGVCPTTNALKIMQMNGLPVE